MASSTRKLPLPYSAELLEVLKERGYGSVQHQHIYAVLFARFDDPPTTVDIDAEVAALMGKPFAQSQRRRRQLAELFLIAKLPGHRYRLDGWRTVALGASRRISSRVRYLVVEAGRCAKCGRSVADDGVTLEIDHVLPRSWGGSDERENLQALCRECNQGKKAYYSEFDAMSTVIEIAVAEPTPHRRIAMLHMGADGGWLPSGLIGAVASVGRFQEDWRKRQRELRYLGWVIESRRSGTAGRVEVHYRARVRQALPNGDLAQAVRAIERQRRAARDLREESNQSRPD